MSPPLVLLAVVTDGRAEMNLQCCVSILHLQVELMTATSDSFGAELMFARDLNDVLDRLHRDKRLVGAFVIRHNASIPGPFALKAFRSKERIVVSPTPLPVVDWERVKNHVLDAAEDTRFSGNVYNVKLEGLPRSDGYARVASMIVADGMFVRRDVVDGIAEKHPEIASDDKSAFALDGVYGGKYATGTQRFLDLYGDKVWADVENQGGASGPIEYVGCVGARKVLR
jgi:hypothetical protein